MFSRHARNTILFSLQTSSRNDYLFSSFLSHRPAIREISLTRTQIVEQIIAKTEMIEANAINIEIWKRRFKKRRKCRSKSCEWESWLQKRESWLQRDVENARLFVWRKDRFLWQNRNRTTERYRFRERKLLKTFRIWAFQILTNRCLLIGCRRKIDDDSRLIESVWSIRLTTFKTLWKRTTILMLM